MMAITIEKIKKWEKKGKVKKLIKALEDKDKDIRMKAAEALGKMGDIRAVQPLTRVFSDEIPLKNKAIEALGKIGDATAVDAIIKALEKEIEIFPGDNAAFETLLKLGSAKVVGPLIKALGDEHKRIRWKAASLLGVFGETEAVDPLINALDDDDNFVRKVVASALGKIGDTKAFEPLLAALKDKDRGVRESAVKALGKTGDARVFEPLIETLIKDIDGSVRGSATEVLGEMGDPKAVEPLVKALAEDCDDVRKYAAEALKKLGWKPTNDKISAKYYIAEGNISKCEKIGDPAVGPLISKLYDSNQYVRRQTAEVLKRIYKSKNLSPENKKAILKLKGKKISETHIDGKNFDPATCHKDHTDKIQDTYFDL